jgi:hypothetical protein
MSGSSIYIKQIEIQNLPAISRKKKNRIFRNPPETFKHTLADTNIGISKRRKAARTQVGWR